ncbi:hypothetical protein [Rhizobium vallis]|uniref:hypothetical protein n=1 Tax=Rhizobium vallis TaxID=634290 RepID=UPI000F878ADC|nr:hypothetical protein [Rhizobium vallis]
MRTNFSRKYQPEFRLLPAEDDEIHLGYLAAVFIFFGVLSLITAWKLSEPVATLHNGAVSFRPQPIAEEVEPLEAGEEYAAKNYALIGPFTIDRPGQVLKVEMSIAQPALNAWCFVEGELLDEEQDYLLSFGQELWHEKGRDDEGLWDETEKSSEMKLTIPQRGKYYFNIKTQGNFRPDQIFVTLTLPYASSIPHTIFGILTLLIGVALEKIRRMRKSS